jgi:hypothetical protein
MIGNKKQTAEASLFFVMLDLVNCAYFTASAEICTGSATFLAPV